MRKVRFLGLDVYADTIAAAMAEPSGDVRSVGVIPNRPESIRKLVKKLGPVESLRVCYEAGPTGGDCLRCEPQRDVTSLDQRSVVRRPVANVVFRLIGRMHSRLHVEIMRLRPSR